MAQNIDWDFLRKVEGFRNRAYVPNDPDGGVESGVTIGTGLDLGWQDQATIEGLGFPKLAKRLAPYYGVRGKAAQQLVNRRPLKLDNQQLMELDQAYQLNAIKRLSKVFDEAVGKPGSFETLPPEMATVMASVAHQYGGDLAERTPNFWNQMTTGQYDKALNNLRNFGDQYSSRRNKEADLFQRALITQFLAGS